MTGRFLSKGQNAPIGYRAQAGGAVTQLTSKATAVTIDKLCGQITLDDAELVAATEVTFTVNNNLVEEGDVPILAIQGGGTSGEYAAFVTDVADGSFDITLTNLSGSNASDADIIINFAIIKAVAE